MIDIVYQEHSLRRKKAAKIWHKVLTDYNSGHTAQEIAKRNKKTRSWVYWVLRKFKNNEV